MEAKLFLFFTSIILISLLLINYIVYKNIFSPSILFSATWLMQVIGLLMFSHLFENVSPIVLLVVVIGVALFSFGQILDPGIKITISNLKDREVNLVRVRYLISILIISICLFEQVRIFNDLTSGMEMSVALVFIRNLISIESEDIYGIFKYGTTFGQAIIVLMLISLQRDKSSFSKFFCFILVVLATLCMAFLSTGRGQVLQIFILLTLVYLLSTNISQFSLKFLKITLLILAISFLIFWQMGKMMGKVGESGSEALIDLLSYQFSPIPALSAYLSSHEFDLVGGDGGLRSFRVILAIMYKLGFGDAPPILIEEFVYIPHPTNIYTIYLMPLRDFGWIGSFLYIFLIGLLHGYIYRAWKKDKSNDFAKYIFIISFIPLIQSPGGDAYLSLISTWVQFITIGIIFTIKRKPTHLIKNHG